MSKIIENKNLLSQKQLDFKDTDGIGVNKSDLQPGDLVFYGTNGPTHMGMYIGNGTYIHAPRAGDVIKISSVDRSDYITARRVK